MTREAASGSVTLLAIGDIGEPHGRDPRLHDSMARRLAGADGAPILVLGDVFYGDGLLGFCRSDDKRVSRAGCERPGSVDAQLDAILGPYARKLPSHPVVALAGNHDHSGDPLATANACAKVPAVASGWRYVARGCAIDDARPIEVLDLGSVVVVMIDSQAMLFDGDFRAHTNEALHAELARLRQERPQTWLALAMHHPLESYGLHNGAAPLASLHKDLYPLTSTLLAPIRQPIEIGTDSGAQQLYEWRNRAYRRGIYRALEGAPVDVVLSGHDHSLQLVELDHPGARWQIVSGAGAKHSKVQRLGLDLLWSNRLARLIGLRDALPAVGHELAFAAGEGDDLERAGFGYAVLVATPDALRVEFWDLAVSTPLGVATLRR
ncbi:MAG: metallophosphoesterase [bacterium]